MMTQLFAKRKETIDLFRIRVNFAKVGHCPEFYFRPFLSKVLEKNKNKIKDHVLSENHFHIFFLAKIQQMAVEAVLLLKSNDTITRSLLLL